ncbi:ComEA family DNA-binding protein [Rhodopirellula sp. P2]|uniref:ComEA family DNA-binding protein n=1 Tax=Rhodopirellula sp. P2 TaxID=2127060 RepID=UPI0023681346|nr:helix-hairpin-helix domain-containing protein [Rhodopirellula sp. P2]WDQ16893.1 helix-hairpin-helix domain-containing protein [Rhodopirellula sp. P2]
MPVTEAPARDLPPVDSLATESPTGHEPAAQIPAAEAPAKDAPAESFGGRTACVLTHPGLQLGMSLVVLVAAFLVTQIATRHAPADSTPQSPDVASPLSIGLNSSDVRELSLLPGIGPKLADRVVRHRESHGPFRSVEGLLAVHGVGPKLLQSLRPWVHVSQSAWEPSRPISAPDHLVWKDH